MNYVKHTVHEKQQMQHVKQQRGDCRPLWESKVHIVTNTIQCGQYVHSQNINKSEG